MKKHLVRIIIAVSIIAIVIFIFVFKPFSTIAAWYDNAYGYRKQITITGTTAGVQTNYQMKMTVYKSTGTDSSTAVYVGTNVQDDFDDLRFTKSDGTTLLDYWVESYISATSAIVWVEFDSIPASPSTANFYIYYGNASASSGSSISNTWAIGDDFEDNSLSANWTVDLGTWTETSGQLHGTNAGARAAIWYTGANMPANFRILTRSKASANYPTPLWPLGAGSGDPYDSSKLGMYLDNYYDRYWIVADSDSHIEAQTFEIATWYIAENVCYGNTATIYGFNSSRAALANPDYSYTMTSKPTGTKFAIRFFSETGDVEYIAVGNYASPEPTWTSWGSETQGAPTVTTQAASVITTTTALGNGNITVAGFENATVRGFKYGLTQTDTWSTTENGSFTTGAFTGAITGLSAGTTYYVRAYATNSAGTSYGAYQSFTTTAAWYDNAYGYRKQITITGTTAGVQTNYQMKMTVYKSTGTDSSTAVYVGTNVQDDFDDLRFTKSDGTTLLDYWVESYISATSAIVWVEFDSIPASPSTANFYIYYGNASASSGSNGTNTFIAFDDFEWGNDEDNIDTNGGSITWSKTVAGTSTAKIDTSQYYSGSRSLRVYRDGTNSPIAYFTKVAGTNYAIRFTLRKDTNAALVMYHGDGVKCLDIEVQTTEEIQYYDGSYHSCSTPTYVTVDAWGILEFTDINHTTPKFDIWFNGTQIQDNAAMRALATTFDDQINLQNQQGTSYLWIDNIIVRNWTSPEPTWTSWGSETQGAPTVTTQAASVLSTTTATGRGNITVAGFENATVRGFKYGLTETDTWSTTESGSFGTGAFSGTITGLNPETTYYIRAYATNSAGTSYGAYQSFTTNPPWYDAAYGYRKQITINGSTATQTLNLQVNASGDDCIRTLEANTFTINSGNVWVGWWTNGWSQGGAGLRFANVTIPQGSTISTAYVTFTANSSLTGTAVYTKISAEKSDDAATFTGLDAAGFDTRFANHTTARPTWNNIGSWTSGATTNAITPEIKTVIQEIVSRPGWISGKHIVLFWEDFDDLSTFNTAYRNAYAYNSASAPILHIEYIPLSQTNYQMKITVNKGAGTDSSTNVYLNNHVQDDFDDIRFTKSDRITPLDYWTESYTSGTSATVWVEFDSIPASPSTANFYIYYDNASASSGSNGDNTFQFFDDFADNSIDTNKWNTATAVGTWTETGGQLHGYHTVAGQLYNKIATTANLRAVAKSKSNTWYPFSLWLLRDDSYSPYTSPFAGFYLSAVSLNDVYIIYYDSTSSTEAQNFDINTWYIGEALISGNTFTLKGYDSSGNPLANPDYSIACTSKPTGNKLSFRPYGETIDVEYIFVGNYASPEPTWGTWGSEEAGPSTLNFEKVDMQGIDIPGF